MSDGCKASTLSAFYKVASKYVDLAQFPDENAVVTCKEEALRNITPPPKPSESTVGHGVLRNITPPPTTDEAEDEDEQVQFDEETRSAYLKELNDRVSVLSQDEYVDKYMRMMYSDYFMEAPHAQENRPSIFSLFGYLADSGHVRTAQAFEERANYCAHIRRHYYPTLKHYMWYCKQIKEDVLPEVLFGFNEPKQQKIRELQDDIFKCKQAGRPCKTLEQALAKMQKQKEELVCKNRLYQQYRTHLGECPPTEEEKNVRSKVYDRFRDFAMIIYGLQDECEIGETAKFINERVRPMHQTAERNYKFERTQRMGGFVSDLRDARMARKRAREDA